MAGRERERVKKDFTDLIASVRDTLHVALDLEKSHDVLLVERERLNNHLMLALDDIAIARAELLELYRMITELQYMFSPNFIDHYASEYGGRMVKVGMKREHLSQGRDPENTQTSWSDLSQDDRDLYVAGSSATVQLFVTAISNLIEETLDKGVEEYVHNEYTQQGRSQETVQESDQQTSTQIGEHATNETERRYPTWEEVRDRYGFPDIDQGTEKDQ